MREEALLEIDDLAVDDSLRDGDNMDDDEEILGDTDIVVKDIDYFDWRMCSHTISVPISQLGQAWRSCRFWRANRAL